MARLFAVFLTLVTFTAPASAAQLVMFETDICEWCETWHHDLGEVYPKTPEGRRAPLRRVDLYDPIPEDLRMLQGIRFTPTFVLMDQGREIGRILGYPGESFFWGQLETLLEKADRAYACGPKNSTEKTKQC